MDYGGPTETPFTKWRNSRERYEKDYEEWFKTPEGKRERVKDMIEAYRMEQNNHIHYFMAIQDFLRAIDHETNVLQYYFGPKYIWNESIGLEVRKQIFNQLKEINDKFNRRTII